MTPDELKEILEKNPLTLLYFSTPTCSVCKVLRPKIEKELRDTPPWHFQYVNTEASMELAGQYLVFAVPTILLMADSREIGRFSRHFGMDELMGPIRRYSKLMSEN